MEIPVNNPFIDNSYNTAVYCGESCYLGLPLISNNDAYSPGGRAFGGKCAGYAGNFGNISADPFFVNQGANAFELLAGSLAIDAGSSSAPALSSMDFAGPTPNCQRHRPSNPDH